jgi:diacylglycerol O-acyltransferase
MTASPLTIQRMSPVDRAWLLMERPTNPMMIVAVIVLAKPLRRARLKRLLAERFLRFDRFRCYPASEMLSAQWVPAVAFDLDDHVVSAALSRGAKEQELQVLAGELASSPFSAHRPWWSFHLVENYGTGSAIIIRIHHCYADGIALVRVLLSLAGRAKKAAGARRSHGARSAPGVLDSLLGFTAPVADLMAKALQEAGSTLGQGLHYALHPGEALQNARDSAGVLGDAARLVTQADDPKTLLKRPLSGVRHVAWGKPLRFDDVRAVSGALGCTINDVLLATLAGAIGGYLKLHGEQRPGLKLHAAVPVNMRGDAGAEPELGNRFGMVFVELPVSVSHPLIRVDAVHRTTQALKNSSQALLTFGLLAAVGSLPAAIEDPAIDIFTAKASLVASNLPGPRELLRIAGAPVSQMLFWVPQAGSIGTGVSMLTYNDQVQFGVIADRELIADPRTLVKLIGVEFTRLLRIVQRGARSVAA